MIAIVLLHVRRQSFHRLQNMPVEANRENRQRNWWIHATRRMKDWRWVAAWYHRDWKGTCFDLKRNWSLFKLEYADRSWIDLGKLLVTAIFTLIQGWAYSEALRYSTLLQRIKTSPKLPVHSPSMYSSVFPNCRLKYLSLDTRMPLYSMPHLSLTRTDFPVSVFRKGRGFWVWMKYDSRNRVLVYEQCDVSIGFGLKIRSRAANS